MFAQYERTFTLNTAPFTINGEALYANPIIPGVPNEQKKNQVKVKNSEKIIINLKTIANITRISGLSGGTLLWNGDKKEIQIENAGTVYFYYYTQSSGENEKMWHVMIHVNYFGVLQYNGGDAPSEIIVTEQNENSLLTVKNSEKFAIGWLSSLLGQNNYVLLHDLSNLNISNMSLKEIILKSKEVHGES